MHFGPEKCTTILIITGHRLVHSYTETGSQAGRQFVIISANCPRCRAAELLSAGMAVMANLVRVCAITRKPTTVWSECRPESCARNAGRTQLQRCAEIRRFINQGCDCVPRIMPPPLYDASYGALQNSIRLKRIHSAPRDVTTHAFRCSQADVYLNARICWITQINHEPAYALVRACDSLSL